MHTIFIQHEQILEVRPSDRRVVLSNLSQSFVGDSGGPQHKDGGPRIADKNLCACAHFLGRFASLRAAAGALAAKSN